MVGVLGECLATLCQMPTESGSFDCSGLLASEQTSFAQDDGVESNMSIRSMTGFAQVKGQVNGQLGFTLSLKSVNHRFLDIHFRMPSDSDDLEMKLRRRLKERMARGHVELTLNIERNVSEGFTLN